MTTWLVSVNPRIYNYKVAIDECGYVECVQVGKYRIGETAYIYIGYTDRAIRYKTVVIEQDLSYEETSHFLTEPEISKRGFSRFKIVESLNDNRLTLDFFKKFGMTNPAGCTKLTGDLLLHIDSVFAGKKLAKTDYLERWERFAQTTKMLSESFPGISSIPKDGCSFELNYYNKKIAVVSLKGDEYLVESDVYLDENGTYSLEETSAIGQLIEKVEDTEYQLKEQCLNEFAQIDEDLEDVQQLLGMNIDVVIKARINQGAFRCGLIMRYGSCCICGISNDQLLNASHIKPWACSSAEEKTDFNNGLLLCPNHDRLFDRHLITFDANGDIIVSQIIDEHDRALLDTDGNRIYLTPEINHYMEHHRAEFWGKETERKSANHGF